MTRIPTIEMGADATLDITVILCTYNRCQDLGCALESIVASEIDSSRTWELLVIDNNSNDDTRNVVEDFSRRFPGRFRYSFEKQPGQSFARNAGIANARGEVLVFTDDDVIVDPKWLQNLTAGSRNEKWSGAGGKILPGGNFEPPLWLPNNLADWGGIFCAYFDDGDTPRQLQRSPYGANMSYRRSMFAKYGGFRTDLGRSPSNKMGNEDTEMGRRLIAAGEFLQYEPSAIVHHPVPKARITQEFFAGWWFDYGRAMIRERDERPALWGIPRDYVTLLRLALKMPVITLRWLLTINLQNRFRNKCWFWLAKGQMHELNQRITRGTNSQAPTVQGTTSQP